MVGTEVSPRMLCATTISGSRPEVFTWEKHSRAQKKFQRRPPPPAFAGNMVR
jgi:hypothetical protein